MRLVCVHYDAIDHHQKNEIDKIRHLSFEELRKIYVLSKRDTVANQSSRDFGWISIAVLLYGCACAYFEYRLNSDELCIKSLCVKAEMRRTGILRQLIKQLLEEHKNPISLWCVEHTGNRDIFERLGFHLALVEVSPYFSTPNGHGVMEYKMIRQL